jgi:hypothetical protein
MSMPCENCVTLAMCKAKDEISCVLVDDWVYLYDHDPGFRGAKARALWVKDFFKMTRVITNNTLMVVVIDKGELK